MKVVTIIIPDNCELVKEGNTYVIKEKDTKPKSWEEFCEKFSIKSEEYFIDTDSDIVSAVSFNNTSRREYEDKNVCINKREAEAFLALIQLRQLRKAWVGDWKQPHMLKKAWSIMYFPVKDEILIKSGYFPNNHILSFPSSEMAKEFLDCFKDLLETAKILL